MGDEKKKYCAAAHANRDVADILHLLYSIAVSSLDKWLVVMEVVKSSARAWSFELGTAS